MTGEIAPVNIFSRAHKRDPFPFYARLRAEAPVFRTTVPVFGDVWLVTRYDDVAALLKDGARFVKDPRNAGLTDRKSIPKWFPASIKALEQNMLDMDEPAHGRLRRLVNAAFTRRRIEQLRPRVQEIATELLDGLAGRGSADLMADFALPLPLIVICELLGVPVEDRRKFHRWSQAFLSNSSNLRMALALPRMFAFVRYLRRLFDERRADPRDDLVSALAQAEDRGDRLNDHELVAMAILLLIAGHETTVNLIGSGTLALLQNGAERDRLVRHPALIATAIEELLRFAAPVETTTERYAAETMTLHGQTIAQGDVVFAVIASANRDETRFADPDRLDLGRDPNPNIAFGQGIHFCIGAHLAKMEAEIAFNSLLDRFPALELAAPAETLRWRETPVVRGLEALPVAF